jgi:hypothetical protein
MKISLKLANGATLEFEGDQSEFERISEFLSEPPESLTAEGATSSGSDAPLLQGRDDSPKAGVVEPATVEIRLEQVGAANDQERMTVMAQVAVESGREGIDYDTLSLLYTELALRKPAQFPTKTLSNAKASGLMQPVKAGIWRPTFRGENFARGLGRGRVSSRSSASEDTGGEDE